MPLRYMSLICAWCVHLVMHTAVCVANVNQLCLYNSYPNQKHPSCKRNYKKSCSQDLKKNCDEKWGGQGLCRNAIDYIKNFDNDHSDHKTFSCLSVLWPEKNVLWPDLFVCFKFCLTIIIIVNLLL